MKQEKKQPGRLKMLAGYYKPYKGLFFADLFFAFLGAAVTLVIPLMVRYIMNSISEMSADEAKTMILKIGVGMLVLILVQLGSRYFITYYCIFKFIHYNKIYFCVWIFFFNFFKNRCSKNYISKRAKSYNKKSQFYSPLIFMFFIIIS